MKALLLNRAEGPRGFEIHRKLHRTTLGGGRPPRVSFDCFLFSSRAVVCPEAACAISWCAVLKFT